MPPGFPSQSPNTTSGRILALWLYPSAEAQAAAIADDIAYDAHDIDDGLRADLFGFDELRRSPSSLTFCARSMAPIRASNAARRAHEVVRRVITRMIEDVIAETGRRLTALAPA